MVTKLKTGAVCATLALSLALSACGGGGDASGNATGEPSDTSSPASAGDTGAKVAAPTLAEGPDVCFKAIAKHLGPQAKVMEITSFFSAGKDIDGNAREPEGTMTTCTVQYQNPDDPRKVLATRLDTDTGTFSEPQAVELSVMGGNASEFKLDDYVIPLANVDAAALKGVMDAQKAPLGGVYSKYAWTGVRLEAPGSFSNEHRLRLDVDGRLASNDLKENGYASVSIDGKTITTNHLLP